MTRLNFKQNRRLLVSYTMEMGPSNPVIGHSPVAFSSMALSGLKIPDERSIHNEP